MSRQVLIDGLEAVNCLKKGSRPDVILLDLPMPVVNGWELRMSQKRAPISRRFS